ncbi:hypothetical protein [Streptomyces ipomoeae]|uniref:hypothetical protein n=1 Tax=Streptomyces ipomoeae TaxID=103232 RepID=UPI0011474CA8|nr:hypothetical protein [Streptomyces ipomoeae]TQE33052.1 hypothetical protein Sipo7851_21350 [Streptomyces ipomoeae]
MPEAPQFPDVEVQLSGEDGNVFSVIGRVAQALRQSGHRGEAQEFAKAAYSAGSYDEVLQLAMRTVDVS